VLPTEKTELYTYSDYLLTACARIQSNFVINSLPQIVIHRFWPVLSAFKTARRNKYGVLIQGWSVSSGIPKRSCSSMPNWISASVSHIAQTASLFINRCL